MRKILFSLFVCAIAGFSAVNIANAEITVKDYLNYDFLDKQGYSQETLRLVEVTKAKTFGETLPDPWPQNKFKRYWAKFWAYTDPADDPRDFGNHDIKSYCDDY